MPDDLHGEIVRRRLFRRLTRDQPTPCLVAFMNNLGSIFFVFGFTRERKRVFWFSIRNLVNPKESKIDFLIFILDFKFGLVT